MFGAALLMLLDNLPRAFNDQASACHKTYGEVEWTTIFFFIGLFIVVYGLESTGLLDTLALEVIDLTGGDPAITALSILWVSAVASAVVDNIPFVATMIPLIEGMEEAMGGSEQLMPLWWSLALGSCLGGNGSLVGASANLIVAGFADRAGQPIRFMPFMLMAFPLMIFSIAMSSVYVYFRFLL
jgi:Na+/H+ antiporter NhaD/arsenite permease-like protein